MALNKNQFKDNSISTPKVNDLSIVDVDISETANIQQSKILNLISDLNSKVDNTGDILSGYLTLFRHPLLPNELATKKYAEDNFPTAASTLSIIPNFSTDNNIVRLTPFYIAHENGQIQLSDTPINISFQFSTIENGQAPQANTFYYLYASGTGFMFSLLAPTSHRLHPTFNWIYIGSLKTNSSGQLQKFTKLGNLILYPNIPTLFSTGTQSSRTLVDLSTLIPPTSNTAYINAQFNLIGTFSHNMQFFFDNTNPALNTFNFAGTNQQFACYIYNAPRTFIPLNNKTFYYTLSGGNVTCQLLGYWED